jgi:Flp pilus assembly protein protease CpaA
MTLTFGLAVLGADGAGDERLLAVRRAQKPVLAVLIVIAAVTSFYRTGWA